MIDPKLLVKPKDKKPLFGLRQVLATVLVVAGALLFVRFRRARAQAQLMGCRGNLTNIGTALDMYYSDYKAYPGRTSKLIPNYLKRLPTCPSVSWAPGDDSYSASYRVSPDRQGYTFYCAGAHHGFAGEAANYPQYNSKQGLLP